MWWDKYSKHADVECTRCHKLAKQHGASVGACPDKDGQLPANAGRLGGATNGLFRSSFVPLYVKCIDNHEVEKDLTLGQIYEVDQSPNSMIGYWALVGKSISYKVTRFQMIETDEVPVSTPIFLKCISNIGVKNEGLIEGKVYQLDHITAAGDAYFLKEKPGLEYKKERFEIVDDPNKVIVQSVPAVTPQVIVETKEKAFDWEGYNNKLPNRNRYHRQPVDSYTGLPLKD